MDTVILLSNFTLPCIGT